MNLERGWKRSIGYWSQRERRGVKRVPFSSFNQSSREKWADGNQSKLSILEMGQKDDRQNWISSSIPFSCPFHWTGDQIFPIPGHLAQVSINQLLKEISYPVHVPVIQVFTRLPLPEAGKNRGFRSQAICPRWRGARIHLEE